MAMFLILTKNLCRAKSDKNNVCPKILLSW